jgi:RNA polymerase sigma-70 factor (ECF subfamily)
MNINPSMSSETRASLLVRLRDRHEIAWHEFLSLYTPVIYSYCLRRGLQASDAEDITQEVLLEVARCIRSFEYQPQRGRFRDWLNTITWRRLARFWNQQRHSPEALLTEDLQSSPDPVWTESFHAVVLQQALQNIQPGFTSSTWQLFLANWQQGLPAKDVARQFGVPIEMVYHAKSRGLKQLEAEVIRLSDDCAWLDH